METIINLINNRIIESITFAKVIHNISDDEVRNLCLTYRVSEGQVFKYISNWKKPSYGA